MILRSLDWASLKNFKFQNKLEANETEVFVFLT